MAQSLKFTDEAIAALPLPRDGSRTEYADSQTTGLRLRVSSRGVKTFSLLRRVKNGHMERITLGRFPEIKTKKATDEARKLIGAIADGANPGELKRIHRGEPTFGEFFEEYMTRHSKPNKRTWSDDEQKYRDHISKELGKKKITQIDKRDIALLHSSITRKGHPTTANRVKALCSSVFSKAVEWGVTDSNPAISVKSNREHSRARFLEPHELPRLFNALEEETNPSFRDFFVLALLTGARRGNLRSMQWNEIDFDTATWSIPGDKSKNGSTLKIPLVPEAAAILRSRKEGANPDSIYVFPAARADSKHGHMSGERKAWLRLLKKANLDNVRIHDLRRTMGSWQARNGANSVIIGRSLGHKSQQATAIYARVDIDPVRDSMSKAASAMLSAGDRKPSAEIINIQSGKGR